MGERPYWVAFNLVKGIGPVRVRQLLSYFGSLAAAWDASRSDLKDAGLDSRSLNSLMKSRPTIDPQAEMLRLDRLGISVLTWDDDIYPALLQRLRQIDHAPPVLYMRGSLSDVDEWAIAVVGTRSASPYGRQVTRQIVTDLAHAGMVIVSGLARGIDGEAHQAALDAGGRSIAVLPCGLDQVYPPDHRQLARQLLQNGAVISPFPLGTKPIGRNFSARNLVLSGLSRAVLVTEAGLKSGALITAGHALEQGRDVFAVPGNITAQGSKGTNQLVQDGALPVLNARDILEALNVDDIQARQAARRTLPDMSDIEEQVLVYVGQEPQHIDEIQIACHLPIHEVSSALVTLELKGLIRQVGVMIFVQDH